MSKQPCTALLYMIVNTRGSPARTDNPHHSPMAHVLATPAPAASVCSRRSLGDGMGVQAYSARQAGAH